MIREKLFPLQLVQCSREVRTNHWCNRLDHVNKNTCSNCLSLEATNKSFGKSTWRVQSNAGYLAITVFWVVWLLNIFYGRFWYHCFVLIISFNLIPFLPKIIVPIISMAGSGLWGGIWPGGQFLLGADAKVRGRVIIGCPKFTSSKTAW